MNEEMELDEHGYNVEYPIFNVSVVGTIEEAPGCWNSVKVGVYQQDSKDAEKKLLGTFDRNYHTNFNNFSYTRKGDRYFALYSPHYTCTRVMEILPGEGFKDIGGEEKHGYGFCPTDLYIPTVHHYVNEAFDTGPTEKIKDWSRLLDFFPPGSRKSLIGNIKERKKLKYPDGKYIRAYKHDHDHDYAWVWGPELEYESGYVILPPVHAFVAGCYWGDDSSYKVQHIDVSRIDEGIILRDERFGYVELPSGLTLKTAINCENITENHSRIRMAIDLEFDLESGQPVIWSNALYQKILEGRKFVETFMFNNRAFDYDKELRQRWVEQGEHITAEVLASGGMIR